MILHRRLAAVLSLAFLLVLAAASPSKAARWRELGPHQQGLRAVTALAFDPSRPERAFAGLSGGGIARSGDGGRTWQPMSVGLTGQISSIVVHPRLGRLVYTLGNDLFRSLNDGRSWRPLPLQNVRAVAVDARDPAVVWAGTPAGLFRSRDLGETWRRIQANLPDSFRASRLAVSSVDPQRLYVGGIGSGGRGLWTSGDGGRSWRQLEREVPLQVFADLHAQETVYVVEPQQIRRSRDAGQTWEVFFDSSSARLPGLNPLAFAADPRDASTFFVSVLSEGVSGVYRTTDGGRRWQRLTHGLPRSLEALELAVAADGTVLLRGVFNRSIALVLRSPDAGESWEEVSRGPLATGVSEVAVSRSGGLFAMVFGHGVDRSLDGGATWTISLRLRASPSLLKPDPHDPETLYAGTRYPFGSRPAILWKTVDNGESWVPLPYPLPITGHQFALAAMDLAVDPADPRTLYLATQLDNAGFDSDAGIFRSRDGGETWEKVGVPGSYQSVAVHLDAPGTVLALSPLGIYRSVDDGDTWAQVLGRGDSLVRYLGISPADASVVYAVRDDGLFRSDDGGATFRPLGQRLPGAGPRTIALDPLDPDTLVFAGHGGIAVRLTLGQGREILRDGLFGSFILVLEFDPNDPLRLLAGTEQAGLMEYRFEAPPAP